MQEVMRQKAGGDYYAGKLRHTMMILNSKKKKSYLRDLKFKIKFKPCKKNIKQVRMEYIDLSKAPGWWICRRETKIQIPTFGQGIRVMISKASCKNKAGGL